MAEQQSAPPRYWIFRESRENQIGPDDPDTKFWLIEPNSEVEPSDFVYFWREEDSSYFYGWGIIETLRTPLYARSENMPSLSAAPFGVQVRHHLFQSNPVTRQELFKDPDLEPLSWFDRRNTSKFVLELSNAQAAALNRLIRDRGVDAPPDPIVESSEEWGDGKDGGADHAAATSLGQLWERSAGRWSILTRDILEQAKIFARTREHHRDKITTSCILFAAIELGQGFSDQEVDNAAQFIYRWLADQRGPVYRRELAAFQGASDPQPGQGVAILTSNALQVIETAARIANLVRKETITSKRDAINARDLVGALLFTMARNPKLGAVNRLDKMDVSLKKLRSDYYSEYLSHKNPDDDIEKWRRIIIDLELPEEKTRVPETLPTIDADTPSLKDHLNITPEVEGFAKIIAASDVKTPLSIGIFGDWGSGKSTFMEQLQATVDKISKGVREKKEDEKTAFLGNIVQIKFNAWHYAEANLWASLVSHVFENLSFSEVEEKEKAEKRKQLFIGKLVTTLETQRVAEAEVKAKEANYEIAKTALDDAQRDRVEARLKLSHVLTQGIWPLVRKFMSQDAEAERQINEARRLLGRAGLSEEEMKREIEASKTTAGRLQLRLTSIAKDRHRAWWMAAILALTILIPVVVTFAVTRLGASEILERVLASVTPLITLICGTLAWLRTKRKSVDSMLDTLDAAGHQIDRMFASARGEYEAERQRLSNEVETRQAEIESARKVVEDATKERAETITALREMEPARVLETFVQERAASEDYRKLLGVVALIRRDFKRLSDMLREQGNVELRQAVTEILKKDDEQKQLEAKAAAAAGLATATDNNGHDEPTVQVSQDLRVEETLKEYRIDRIVLYIDDLDRCPPKQVVDVLQAIHLLLAFELFVVVVGVDARWIRHALRHEFPEMLTEDWDEGDDPKSGEQRLGKVATPRDYVEKIFQVPFWLKPMDDDAAKKLLEGLIPASQLAPIGQANRRIPREGVQSPDGEEKLQSTPTGVNVAHHTGQVSAGSTISSPGGGSKGMPASPAGVAISSTTGALVAELELNPESLLLDVEERDAMVALSRVIGKTPRTLKRFVNVYRIIKAGLTSEELAAFVGNDTSVAHYKAVLVLLGIAHGAPEIAPAFFRELRNAHNQAAANKRGDVGLKSFLKPPLLARPSTLDESFQPSWAFLIKELHKFANRYPDDIPLAVFRQWLPVIVRYTFQLGRLSEEVAIQKPSVAEVTKGEHHA